jgi:hypothetical protein
MKLLPLLEAPEREDPLIKKTKKWLIELGNKEERLVTVPNKPGSYRFKFDVDGGICTITSTRLYLNFNGNDPQFPEYIAHNVNQLQLTNTYIKDFEFLTEVRFIGHLSLELNQCTIKSFDRLIDVGLNQLNVMTVDHRSCTVPTTGWKLLKKLMLSGCKVQGVSIAIIEGLRTLDSFRVTQRLYKYLRESKTMLEFHSMLIDDDLIEEWKGKQTEIIPTDNEHLKLLILQNYF